MECRSRVTKTLLASAESTEVLGSLWDYVVVEKEVDATGLLCEEGVSFVAGGMTTSTVGRGAEAELQTSKLSCNEMGF